MPGPRPPPPAPDHPGAASLCAPRARRSCYQSASRCRWSGHTSPRSRKSSKNRLHSHLRRPLPALGRSEAALPCSALRAVLMLPVAVHLPVAGSYRTALLRSPALFSPPPRAPCRSGGALLCGLRGQHSCCRSCSKCRVEQRLERLYSLDRWRAVQAT